MIESLQHEGIGLVVLKTQKINNVEAYLVGAVKMGAYTLQFLENRCNTGRR